jgi:Pro-kumamolisin, activation domain
VILARRSLVLGLLFVVGLAAQQKDRLAGPIGGRRIAALAGSRRPGLQPQSDRGRVDPSFRISQITLAFKLSDSQQADLQRLLANEQDRSSADYYHWLSPNEYADRFGLSSNDLSQVRAWLQSARFPLTTSRPVGISWCSVGRRSRYKMPSPPKFISTRSRATCTSPMPGTYPCQRIWHRW